MAACPAPVTLPPRVLSPNPTTYRVVRKISGFTKPSQANQAAFDEAVVGIAAVARHLLESLETTAPPRDREVEAAKARARSAERFGTVAS